MMKKTVLLFLIVVSFSRLKAQDDATVSLFGKIYVGAKVGYGIVNFESTSSSEKHFAKATYDNISYGIIAGYNLSGRISIQLEGNYAQYGANNIIAKYIYSANNPLFTSYSANSTVDHVDMDLYYVDIPLTVRYSLTDGDFSPYFYGGVNWGINYSGNATIVHAINDTQATLYREFQDDISGQIKYNEFSPVVGGGIKMNMGSFSIFGDLRYKFGLMNLSNVNNGLGFTNNALWVSAGLFINL